MYLANILSLHCKRSLCYEHNKATTVTYKKSKLYYVRRRHFMNFIMFFQVIRKNIQMFYKL